MPHGFAIRELVFMSAMVAAIVIGPVAFIELSVNKPQRSLNASTGFVDRVEVFPAIDISLGDDFVAVVGLETFSRPDSAGPTSFYSHLRIARRFAHDVHPFLLSMPVAEDETWDAASCFLWVLAPSDEVEEGRDESTPLASATPLAQPANRKRFLVDRDNQRRDIQHVIDLEPALQALLPGDLQLSHDMLRICSDFKLFQLREMQDFPFPGLAAAIRTVSKDNEWSTTDPQLLLQQHTAHFKDFDEAARTAFAQSLLWRLYTMLPPEDQATVE